MTSKLKELMNRLDPDKVECVRCRKWFSKKDFFVVDDYGEGHIDLCEKCADKIYENK